MQRVEHTIRVSGIAVRVVEAGSGRPLLLIHGSGPGASVDGYWHSVLPDLCARYHVFATDLIGFGGSGRKTAAPFFDVELWLRQCQAVVDKMPGSEIGVIGHSLGGALALRLAAQESRVSAVLTTATLGAAFPANDLSARVWTFPRTREELLSVCEVLFFDKTVVDDQFLTQRETILHQPGYEDYFSSMLSGDKQRFIDVAVLTEEELCKVKCRVMLMHGRDDLAFPCELLSLALADRLTQADVWLLARCAHSVALEQPAKFLAAVAAVFG